MKYRRDKTSQDELNKTLDDLTSLGLHFTSSGEINKNTVIDQYGNSRNIGGNISEVKINNDIPIVINEKQIAILDCGHAITSPDQIYGKCDYGHLICKEHGLYTCELCNKKMCDFEVAFEYGQFLCPDCIDSIRHGQLVFWISIIIVVIILTLTLIWIF